MRPTLQILPYCPLILRRRSLCHTGLLEINFLRTVPYYQYFIPKEEIKTNSNSILTAILPWESHEGPILVSISPCYAPSPKTQTQESFHQPCHHVLLGTEDEDKSPSDKSPRNRSKYVLKHGVHNNMGHLVKHTLPLPALGPGVAPRAISSICFSSIQM